MTTAAAIRLPCLAETTLPAGSIATAPPESLGTPRDRVRMLVAATGRPLVHRRVRDLADVLQPGDLVVRNVSDTLPAALTGVTDDGKPVQVHLSTVGPGGSTVAALAGRRSTWAVEFRLPGFPASRESDRPRHGVTVALRGEGHLRVLDSYPAGRAASRLWTAELTTPRGLRGWLADHGQPIRYGYVSAPWPLAAYRTPYAAVPGSAEMPSAGRSLTAGVERRLRQRGIGVADLVLHCGVSSGATGEPPYAEWFDVPPATAQAVEETRTRGHRVVAVGTTVIRALESAADGGQLRAAGGWTDLVVTPDRPITTVDGLLTGWHEPQASHLMMLQALLTDSAAGTELLCDSYRAALAGGYRWHEFGDLHLLLR